jgi:hypothetical protein
MLNIIRFRLNCGFLFFCDVDFVDGPELVVLMMAVDFSNFSFL